jgi:hypothetical protein
MTGNNLVAKMVRTQTGLQPMVFNAGFWDAGNYWRVFNGFGLNSQASTAGRTDAYIDAIQLITQMRLTNAETATPTGTAGLLENIVTPGTDTGLWALGKIVDFLSLLKTNYVPGVTQTAVDLNKFSSVLRKISPKSYGGVTVEFTNLDKLGAILAVAGPVTDISLAAAVWQALAGDVALARVKSLEVISQQGMIGSAGPVDDPALTAAFAFAEKELSPDTDYWTRWLGEASRYNWGKLVLSNVLTGVCSKVAGGFGGLFLGFAADALWATMDQWKQGREIGRAHV